MAQIVLTTLNAKYIHASFGLRYLMANLGPLRPQAVIAEFDINQRSIEIAERLISLNARIIGFGIYIWNTAQSLEVIAILKRVRPDIVVILGGPEVSYETESQPIASLADYVIQGEADLKFRELCEAILNSPPGRPVALPRIISAPLPDCAQLVLPYALYSEEEIAHRVLYIEASGGCPFTCEFCLSSLDVPVRQVPLAPLLDELQRLLDRGVKQFKFVDRTFNLNLNTSRTILEFFLDRHQPGRFYHFEMVPDRLPEALRTIIARFPRGSLQFEVGIQTFNEEVGARIQRRQNLQRLEENLRFLRSQTGVHIHADLIAGLPGESLESFAGGFDRLIALAPHEIQIGILKRLRGTPISRHDREWDMVFSPLPPYEILRNKLLDFPTLQRLRRFARYWDLVGNSGNFIETTPLIWSGAGSPFEAFSIWCEWLYGRVRRTDGIALARLMELLLEFLISERGFDPKQVAESLWRDYSRSGRTDLPSFLREFLPDTLAKPAKRLSTTLPKRQARHAS